jgi:hypothetical protein
MKILACIRKKMSPSVHLLKGGGKTFWQKTKLCSYRFFIKLLALHYKSYAFSHTIIEDDIRIVHEFRDLEFEKEMSKIGLPINGKTLTGNQYSMTAYGLHFAGSWFEFVDKLIVYYDSQEISISRKRNDSELDYPKKTMLKYSDKQSAIQRIIVENKAKKRVSETESAKDNILETPKKRNKAMEIDDSF